LHQISFTESIKTTPLGSAIAPAQRAHFLSYKCKRDSNYSADFDLTYKCYTSFDPVKCLFVYTHNKNKVLCFLSNKEK